MKRKVTEKLSTFATQLAADIETMVLDHVDDLLDKTRASAVDALRSLVAGGGMQPEPEENEVVHREVKPAKSKRKAVDEKRVDAAEVVHPGKRRCTKCRQPGHRADRCPSAAATSRPSGGKPKATAPLDDHVADEDEVVDDPDRDTAERAAKHRRADIIARRAAGLPTPTSSFDIGGGK